MISFYVSYIFFDIIYSNLRFLNQRWTSRAQTQAALKISTSFGAWTKHQTPSVFTSSPQSPWSICSWTLWRWRCSSGPPSAASTPAFTRASFCKCFTDIVVCLFGVVHLNSTCKGLQESQIGREWSGSQSYEFIFFVYYVAVPGLRIALLASAYSELAVIFNRYYILEIYNNEYSEVV